MSVMVQTRGRVRVVSINRPAVRNAVNPETARLLFDAFMDFETDDTVDVAILTGGQTGFCAGFDLKAAANLLGSDWQDTVAIPANWQDAQAQPILGPMGPSRLMLSKPVIAAVEGHAVAGGLELAAWCDMRVASTTSVMGVFCRRWGVPLIDGGTVRLPRILGQGRANDLILTGRPVSGEEAYRIGLVDRLCPEGHAMEEALILADSLTRYPQGCMRADFLSARPSGVALADGLRREWASFETFAAEGQNGAARFAAGKGRGGGFSDI
ncbi:crotonase/enoyl-CoA hydratase family protein [uncultured Shimia sp.]|uniref:crotonase/enoyl-CoA hydratase family protein n=1 Tax=uncultured Shimia sp. TaxID=573152 RepID=UPI0025DB4550|nr:crotonase/enoyl-CoA hydratase family protein [uncultured Shimia sp.]